MGLAKNIPLFRYRFGSREWSNRIINYRKWKCRPECSTWMRNIFLSVNGVGVIIKTNFVYVLWKDKRPTGVKFSISDIWLAVNKSPTITWRSKRLKSWLFQIIVANPAGILVPKPLKTTKILSGIRNVFCGFKNTK